MRRRRGARRYREPLQRHQDRFAELQRGTLLFTLNISVVFKATSTFAVLVTPPIHLACVHFTPVTI